MKITIFDNHRRMFSTEADGAFELGRQNRMDGEVYEIRAEGDRLRIPIAPKEEAAIGRKQLWIDPLTNEAVRLYNVSSSVAIRLVELNDELLPSTTREVPLPVTLQLGTVEIRIEGSGVELASLAQAPAPPGSQVESPSFYQTIGADQTPLNHSLIPWLKATMDVLQGTASSADSFDRAARALVDLVGLDTGRVLMFDNPNHDGSGHRVVAERIAPGRPDLVGQPWQPSSSILASVRGEKRTFWQIPSLKTESVAGVQKLIVAPILNPQGEAIGALYGDSDGQPGSGPMSMRPITEVDAVLVQLLASAVASGLAHTRLVKMDRELEIGRQIQTGFLPSELPQPDGWEVAAHFQPAREVSGDFYDAFEVGDDYLVVVIADVCDKGVGSALFMSLFRSLLRAFAEQSLDFPDGSLPLSIPEWIATSTISRTNRYVARTHGWQCMFCTVFLGVLHKSKGTLTCINAGHDTPVILKPDGEQLTITPTGPVVGVRTDAAYETQTIALEPGEILVGYTDGVTEARDPAGQFFTEQRLFAALKNPPESASALLSRIEKLVKQHVAGAQPHDDVTMIALRRLP